MFITKALNSRQLFEDVNRFLINPENARLRVGLTKKSGKYIFYNSNAVIIDEVDREILHSRIDSCISRNIEHKIITGNGDMVFLDFFKKI